MLTNFVINQKGGSFVTLRSLSSAGLERSPHTRKVTGSNPVATTKN